ncbi:MAG: hypothetical protein ACYC35_16735 [Pirellulales bacterium]
MARIRKLKTVEAIDRRLDELQDEIAEIDAAQNPQPLQNLADAPVCSRCGKPTTLLRIDHYNDTSVFRCETADCPLCFRRSKIVFRAVHRAFATALRQGPRVIRPPRPIA